MSEEFTFISEDGTAEVRVQPEGPLPHKGEVWIRGRYDDIRPNPLNVRIGKAGVKVWMAIHWLRSSEDDVAILRRRFGNILEAEDIDAARWYYEQNKAEIDERLREEAQTTAV